MSKQNKITKLIMAGVLAASISISPLSLSTVSAATGDGSEALTINGFETVDQAATALEGSASTKMEYSTAADTFKSGTTSLKLSATGTAAPADQLAAFHWVMFQREGYANMSDWRGAESISFWVKNASATAATVAAVDIFEGTFGPLTPKEMFRLSGNYYILDNTGAKVEKTGSLTIPGNYEGEIIIPLSSFTVPSWYGAAEDKVLNPLRIVRADFTFVVSAGQQFPTTLYLDDMKIVGKDLLQVDVLDMNSLQEMQVYGFESVDYEVPTLSFDAKLGDSAFVKTGFDQENIKTGEYALSLDNILTDQTQGENQYGGFGFSIYDLGEGDAVKGKNTGNWEGAQYVGFWINNTNDTNVSFALQCYENAAAGEPYAATRCLQLSGWADSSKTVNYYTTNWHLVADDGTVTTLAQNNFYIPAKFKGKVYIPLNTANFEVPSWQTTYTQPETLKLDRMARLNVTFQPVNNKSIGTEPIYFDNFFIAGKALSEVGIKADNVYGNTNVKYHLTDTVLPQGVFSTDLVTVFNVLDEFDENTVAMKADCDSSNLTMVSPFRLAILDKNIKQVAFTEALEVTFTAPKNMEEATKLYAYSEGKFKEIPYTANADGTITADLETFGLFAFANVLPTSENSQTNVSTKPNDTSSTKDDSPETGDHAGALSILIVLGLAGAALVTCGKRKKA